MVFLLCEGFGITQASKNHSKTFTWKNYQFEAVRGGFHSVLTWQELRGRWNIRHFQCCLGCRWLSACRKQTFCSKYPCSFLIPPTVWRRGELNISEWMGQHQTWIQRYYWIAPTYVGPFGLSSPYRWGSVLIALPRTVFVPVREDR